MCASGYNFLKHVFLLPPSKHDLGQRISIHRKATFPDQRSRTIGGVQIVLQQNMTQSNLGLVSSKKPTGERMLPNPNAMGSGDGATN